MLIPMGFLAASGAAAGPSYDLISTTIVSGTAGSVTFDVSTLGGTYKHLQIRNSMRTNATNGSYSNLGIRFNSDSGSTYRHHYLRGQTTTVQNGDSGAATSIWLGYGSTTFNSTSNWGLSVVDIPDFSSSVKNKTAKSLTGVVPDSSPAFTGLHYGTWFSTSAITSITLLPLANSFESGSRFSLYGIKG